MPKVHVPGVGTVNFPEWATEGMMLDALSNNSIEAGKKRLHIYTIIGELPANVIDTHVAVVNQQSLQITNCFFVIFAH